MIEAVYFAGIGLILGSFANVLIHRGGQNLGGRSKCPHCGRELTWYELVPVFSWIVLRGKCRTCRANISIQYPLVELLTAGGTLAIGLAPAPLSVRLVGIMIVLLLVCITVYDLYHTMIPDRWSYGFSALAFLSGILTVYPGTLGDALLFIIEGPLLALPLAGLWFFSGGRWMGLGDAKLVLGFGWLLGIFPGYIALSLSFCIGAFVGVFLLLPLRRARSFLSNHGITRFRLPRGGFTMRSEVPFGPFLVLGLCILWFAQLYTIDIPAYAMQALAW